MRTSILINRGLVSHVIDMLPPNCTFTRGELQKALEQTDHIEQGHLSTKMKSYWMGVPVTDLDKETLIQVIEFMCEQNTQFKRYQI